MTKNQIILASVVVIGIVAIFAFGNFNNSNTDSGLNSNTTSNSKGYLLSVPNLNFEIIFPEEPNFNRTDGDDFIRHSWSYLKQNSDGSWNRLYVQTENNLYAYNSSQEDFIEQTAQIYGGVVSRMEKDPNAPATDYEITGVYSNSSSNTETIIGRIIDVGEWTFNITNQFEGENRYPNFIDSFKEI